MADLDRSGNSAASSPTGDLKSGANSFKLMLAKVQEIGDQTVGRFGHADGRDYKTIAFEVETAIYASLLGRGKATREGFLRALADYLAIHQDGFGLPDDWDPLATTAPAFAQHGEES